ncbi:hypothetical protein [Hyphomicrobium sp.]|uniref:hypothetical protein n=1 Tax=Hyphomicrobium sp. TaxID=82 RepID=UPI002D797BD0|nr:hypothetical protein [Hyphomicrobium sp.]HET6390364.1 hypothetical protein [Hyphomicrobium sp.]
MVYRPPEEQLEETKARLAAVQKHLEGGEPYDVVPRYAQGGDSGDPGAGGFYRVAENISEALAKSLREDPKATLGLAAVIGFALGAIWRL